jgi:outer membrane protein
VKKTNTQPNSPKNKQQLIINIIFICAIIGSFTQNMLWHRKTAYIDSNKVISGYKEIATAKKEFQKKVELYKERMDTLTGHVKLDMLNMEKFRNDKVQFQHYRDSSQFHNKQVYNYQKAMQQSLQEEEAKLSKVALEKLNVFLKTYGKEHGYDMIFIANNSGTIAYAKDGYDISDDVLKEINKQ